MFDDSVHDADAAQILVVDDTPANLMLLTELLTDHGYRVRPASSGHLALRSVAVEAPDLILLDVRMPEMDGYEVCRRLKSLDQSRRIPVIFISALGEVTDKIKGFDAGGVDYITKPFESTEVFARVRTHLALYSLQKQLQAQNLRLEQQIVERRRAEHALRESQQMLQTVLNTIPVRVFWKDLDSTYLGCNRPLALDAGLHSPEEIIGKNDFEMVWATQAERFRSDDRLVMATGKSKIGYEQPQATPEGDSIWVRTSKVPLLDGEGRIKGILGTYEDITERKKTEEELSKIQRLESLAVLAGGIAHDFNNLLGIILGNISIAKLDLDPHGEPFNLLKEAERACLHSRNLTQKLIAFSEGGAPVRQPESIPEILTALGSLALAGSNVSCQLLAHGDVWPVNCDSAQIHQALMSVMTNAKEATQAGGVIEVLVKNEELAEGEVPPLKQGKYVKITIKDCGLGIPREHLSRIFDPYFSTQDRLTEKGMGLGLTIGYSIIRQHNGYISIDSKAGAGTTVHIYLPAFEANIAETAQHEGPAKK
jgi:two-component system, cell cycle sensor histidine kinase and response regulator CckA